MSPLDALWHLLNLFLLPCALAAASAGAAKLLWRSELKGVAYTRLAGWAALSCSLTALAGLIWFGRDGSMATYGAMVVACALALWAAGFPRPRRG